jgi:hypothetical protein
MKTLFDGFVQYFCNLNEKQKDGYRQVMYPNNRFGFFQTNRKEGYRFMTGTRATEFTLPYQIAEWIRVGTACDALCKDIYNNHGKYLFEVKADKDVENMPLLNAHEEGSFGLFDIVKYHPQSSFPNEFKGTDSQVDEHADPGLFSISLGSTAEGLEMFDPVDNNWIPVPPEAMVLWCGHAVTNISGGKVKPGIHRVRATDSVRLTAWYELCTIDQIPKRQFQMDNEDFKLEWQKWVDEYTKGISMSKSGRPPSKFVNMGLQRGDMRQLRQLKEQQNKK